jgi:murein DD-endopeptidase MepM/ murein hydrolase activator NlpD
LFDSGFIWPAQGRISGVYGSQRILNGKPRRPHYGVDIAAPVGTPVKAAAAGIVRIADRDMYYTGGTVLIDHGYGLNSVYSHLARVTAKEGERVKQGAVIGTLGATGRATGAHLDWRVNLFLTRLDPALLVPPMKN